MKNQLRALGLFGVFALGVAACSRPSNDPPDRLPLKPSGTADFQILSISDWHGQLEPLSETATVGTATITTTYGGIGLLSSYFKGERAANPNTLTLTAGDSIGATPVLSAALKDVPAISGLNFLRLTANTFGNHDFDNTIDELKARIGEAQYLYVSTNLENVTAELGSKVVTPFHMVEVGDSASPVKVALLGITNPDAQSLLFPGRLKTIQISEPVAAANAAAKQAREQGASVVIALVHMGATGKDAAGAPTGPAIDFAKGLEGVDIVLADHTDQQVNATVGNALVVENRSKGRTYARIQIKVVDGTVTAKTAEIMEPAGLASQGLPSGQTCPAVACAAPTTCSAGKCEKVYQTSDPAAEALLQPHRTQLATTFDQTTGTTSAVFTRNGSLERTQEAPIGDLIADALLDRYRPMGAQIAFTNGGGIRASLPSSYAPQTNGLKRAGCTTTEPCNLVIGDIYTVLPFGNTAVVRKIKGELLWKALEHSVSRYPAADGRFLQISGFTFRFKESNVPGSRVLSVTLDDGTATGKNIPNDDQTEYTLVTNDFTNSGGDSYAMLVEASPSPRLEVMADVLALYIKAKGTLDPALYTGRIIREP